MVMGKADAGEAMDQTEPASSRYWKATSGFVYQEMIREREGAGHAAYAQQEQFLTTLFGGEVARRGRPVDVLEFGCGFGRHAAYLGTLEGVRYHGYDFSENMIAPLRVQPPAGVTADRLFCAPSLTQGAAGRRFDIIFTVSVLIHNPPERLPALLEEMAAHLQPGGILVLVENQLVPFGLWENEWHDGCWLHAYPEVVGPGWDLHIARGQVDTHDVYVLRKSGQDALRVFALRDPAQALDTSEAAHLDARELQLEGLAKLKRWTAQVAHALRSKGEGAPVRLYEQEEQLRVERALLARRRGLLKLSDDLAALRAARLPEAAPAPAPDHAARPAREAVLIDDPLDTHWAASDPRWNRVVHVFHQEWHGIRAAAGYLPGRKVAITAMRPLIAEELQRAASVCADGLARNVVLHSYSENLGELARLLRAQAGPGLRLHAVWHGSTAQFHYPAEMESFSTLLALRRAGILNGLACVKGDMHEISPLLYARTLLNVAPSAVKPAARTAPAGAALIPVPNDWRKNFYTNLFAAAAMPSLSKVYVTTAFPRPRELQLGAEVITVERPDRWQLLRLLERVDVILNATLSECQPMTALEGLSARVPCLVGPLSLGGLDAHPYTRLVTVPVVDSVGEVRRALERVLAFARDHRTELDQMMDDYRVGLEREAYERLGEFLAS